jgi:hypothetical protein
LSTGDDGIGALPFVRRFGYSSLPGGDPPANLGAI